MALPIQDIQPDWVYVCQVFSILQFLINFYFYFKVKNWAKKAFNQKWSQIHRSIFYGMLGWVVSGLEALSRALFISNKYLSIPIPFLYTNECPTDGDCLSCGIQRFFLEWCFCWAMAINYMVMISALDESLGATKWAYSKRFLLILKLFMFIPLSFVYITWVISIHSRVYALKDDSSHLMCLNDNTSTSSLGTLMLIVMAFWLILIALFILILFLYKLRQLYYRTSDHLSEMSTQSHQPRRSSLNSEQHGQQQQLQQQQQQHVQADNTDAPSQHSQHSQHSQRSHAATEQAQRSLATIINVMAKQSIIVACHVTSTFFLFIVSNLMGTHSLGILTAPTLSLVHSFITFLMFPVADSYYQCLCGCLHRCCVACYGSKVVPGTFQNSEMLDKSSDSATVNDDDAEFSSDDDINPGRGREETVGTLTRLDQRDVEEDDFVVTRLEQHDEEDGQTYESEHDVNDNRYDQTAASALDGHDILPPCEL